MAIPVMYWLLLVMSIAAIAISLDMIRKCRQIDRWLDKEQAKLDEGTRRRGIR